MGNGNKTNRRIVVGITGASGSCYGVHLVKTLLQIGYEVFLTVSNAGYLVLREELAINSPKELLDFFNNHENLYLYEWDNIAAPIASGSFKTEGMVISPCSMGTLAMIAQGISHNLIARAADVCLKERRTLVLVVRETPLNTIHLENMLTLSRMGVVILPAMPAFYQHPQTLDDLIAFITGRTLDFFNLDIPLYQRYGVK